MQTRNFVVALADLEQGPKSVEWVLTPEWLEDVLAGSGASPDGPGRLHVELSKNGSEVLVRGRAEAAVTMPCARSLEPVRVQVTPDILLLLGRTAVSDRTARPRKRRRREAEPKVPAEPKKGYRAWVDDPELSEHLAGEDCFEGDHVVLDGFVREFLLLDLPMNPVRSDLPSESFAAIPPAPDPDERPAGGGVDPRLAPLAAFAERLKKAKN
ncbi:MAG: DUF177 domain-containing protein [Polyangiaceae bacterium]|nr:DUF177 domain-containing protein [Polyangiaceae bacterium]